MQERHFVMSRLTRDALWHVFIALVLYLSRKGCTVAEVVHRVYSDNWMPSFPYILLHEDMFFLDYY